MDPSNMYDNPVIKELLEEEEEKEVLKGLNDLSIRKQKKILRRPKYWSSPKFWTLPKTNPSPVSNKRRTPSFHLPYVDSGKNMRWDPEEEEEEELGLERLNINNFGNLYSYLKRKKYRRDHGITDKCVYPYCRLHSLYPDDPTKTIHNHNHSFGRHTRRSKNICKCRCRNCKKSRRANSIRKNRRSVGRTFGNKSLYQKKKTRVNRILGGGHTDDPSGFVLL
jgi:hypothetical protein